MVCLQVKRNDEMSDQPKISILANSPVSSHPDHCLSLSIKSYDLKKKNHEFDQGFIHSLPAKHNFYIK